MTSRPQPRRGELLTTREVEVVVLVAQGLTNTEIGQRLHLGTDTVKTHMARACRKLGARNRAHAVALFAGGYPEGEPAGWTTMLARETGARLAAERRAERYRSMYLRMADVAMRQRAADPSCARYQGEGS